MALEHHAGIEVSEDLLEAIRSFPVHYEVEHCEGRISVSPFDIDADCPHCRQRLKVQSFSAGGEIEDLFDAVFEWMNQPGAVEVTTRWREALGEE